MKPPANLRVPLIPATATGENGSMSSIVAIYKNVRKYHRRKKIKPEKAKPAKAKLPNGKYFRKPFYMKRKDFEKMQPGKDKESRKKIRGARNKEAVKQTLLKLQAELDVMFGVGKMKASLKGKILYSKPAGPHRLVVFTQDVCSILGLEPRPAGQYLTRIRKKLKMPRGAFVPLREFCEHAHLHEEDVIPHLK